MTSEPREGSPESRPASAHSEYEFKPDENKVFDDLAGNLSFAGWFIIFVVVAFHVVVIGRWVIQSVPPYDKFRLSQIVWPALLVYCSAQFILTSKAFRKVVETQGSDITHLMTGLRTLNDAFTWLTFIPRLWILFAIIALIIGAILGVIHLLGF